MRVIVTGGCGFVGFNLATHLVRSGHEVTVFDNLVRRGSEMNIPKLRELGINFVHGDIRNPEDFQDLPANAECLVECSAQPSVVSGFENPMYDFKTNVLGAMNCLEFCRRHAIGMIFMSSSRVYPARRINDLPNVEEKTRWDWKRNVSEDFLPEGFHPERGIGPTFGLDGPTKTIYGASKAAADFFCQEYSEAFGLPMIVNRCGVISGEGQFGVADQGWLSFWAISCFLDRRITYFGYKGKQVRDILFIPDLCNLLEIQMNRLTEFSGRVWNVGGGRSNSLSLVEATDRFERLLNKKMITSYSDQVRKGDMIIYITDNTEAFRDFNWAPEITIDQGLERIVAWISDHRDSLVSAGL
jgi:CDP-paratose 2-epimerase